MYGQKRGRPTGTGYLGEHRHIGLRIPVDLYQRILDKAQGRDLSVYIRHCLEDSHPESQADIDARAQKAREDYERTERLARLDAAIDTIIAGDTVTAPTTQRAHGGTAFAGMVASTIRLLAREQDNVTWQDVAQCLKGIPGDASNEQAIREEFEALQQSGYYDRIVNAVHRNE
jgi:hypothetical protein